jgi:hypothetical protein
MPPPHIFRMSTTQPSPTTATGWDRAIATTNMAMGAASLSFNIAGKKPFDSANLLPERAQQKLLDLRQQLADARAIARAAVEAVEDVRPAAMEAARHLRETTARLLTHTRGLPRGADGRPAIEDHPAFTEAKEKAAWTADEVTRLSELAEARGFRAQTLGQLVNAVEAWLAANEGPFATVDVPPSKLKKGATAFEGVEAARARLEGLKLDLQAVRTAPIGSVEAKAIARAEIEQLAERGRPDVFGVIEIGHPITWPVTKASVSAWRDGKPDPFTPTVKTADAVALMAFLFRDQMIGAIETEIDARSDDAHALTGQQRAARERELLASLLQVEREEEHLIALANAAGGNVLRRPGADPMAVLGIAIAATAVADERAPIEVMS